MKPDDELRPRSTTTIGAETAFWDDWNTDYRQPQSIGAGSVPDALGRVVVHAVAALDLTAPRIVEIGCGTGWLAPSLSRLGVYTGWDLSPQSIEIARRCVPDVRFEVRDVHDGTETATADIVLMVDSIAYFRDQDVALRNVSRMLAGGGHLVVTTVNPFAYSRMSWIGPPGYGQVRKWLTKNELHELLDRHDLSIVSSRTVLPEGDEGVLRWINSRRLNRPIERFLGERRVAAAKERVGLGQYRVVVAHGGST